MNPASDSGSRPPVLMIVHAHPDDESSQTGGTLARYAAAGWSTVLVTCTDGALGDDAGGAKPGEPRHDPRRVAAHRSAELDAAAAVLGVRVVVKLGYPDSGVDDSADAESFSRRDVPPMVERMVRLLRLHRPDVLVTYPSNGLSGHPDHVRTHDVVVAAHARVTANGEPDWTQVALGGPVLYFIAMSTSRLRAVRAEVRAALGDDAWSPPEEMGTDDSEITTAIDVTAFWDDKLKALAAHASQPDAAMLLRLFSASSEVTEPVAHVEEYVRASRIDTSLPMEVEFGRRPMTSRRLSGTR